MIIISITEILTKDDFLLKGNIIAHIIKIIIKYKDRLITISNVVLTVQYITKSEIKAKAALIKCCLIPSNFLSTTLKLPVISADSFRLVLYLFGPSLSIIIILQKNIDKQLK